MIELINKRICGILSHITKMNPVLCSTLTSLVFKSMLPFKPEACFENCGISFLQRSINPDGPQRHNKTTRECSRYDVSDELNMHDNQRILVILKNPVVLMCLYYSMITILS